MSASHAELAAQVFKEDERYNFELALERKAAEKQAMLVRLVGHVSTLLQANKYVTEIPMTNLPFKPSDSKIISIALQRLVRVETTEDSTGTWISKIHLLQTFDELRNVVNRR